MKIDPNCLDSFAAGFLRSYHKPESIVDAKADPMRGVDLFSADPTGKDQSMVGVLNVKGALLYSGPAWLEEYGYTTYDLFTQRFANLMNDNRVKTILMRIQSPGGTAFGASEISEMVFEARGRKKIVAYADPYAFSAAYEIGSAASSFYTTKSGMVGSVGAYSMHVDASKYFADKGINVTFIKAGEKKVDGNEFQPLSARAEKDIQKEVDRFYEAFVSDVARNRGVDESYVKENFGKGGRVMSAEALQVGMIDGVSTIEDLIKQEISLLNQDIMIARNKAFVTNTKTFLDLEN